MARIRRQPWAYLAGDGSVDLFQPRLNGRGYQAVFVATPIKARIRRLSGSCSQRPSRGFSLVEVMIAATLIGFILWGVLTTNLQLLRSGVRITQYAEMESQVRRGFEQLGHDLKSATGIRWNNANDLTLTVPTSGGTTAQVTYAWNATTGVFFLVPGADSSATSGRVTLIAGIPAIANGSAGLVFARFDRDGNPATTDLATKRIQVTLTAVRKAQTAAGTSENMISATFTMRNKAVN